MNRPPFDSPRNTALALMGGAVGAVGGALLFGLQFGLGREGTALAVLAALVLVASQGISLRWSSTWAMVARRVLFCWAVAAMTWRSVSGRRETDPWAFVRTWRLVGIAVALWSFALPPVIARLRRWREGAPAEAAPPMP